ncbi:MAG: PIN domain-containing protein, partial [Cardiobacteriaceae bacterium]|nr:PIN domain-containing protein [Cardiobacteriaceae bacterium]
MHVHFVRLEKAGKNALDFYLSYYLGRITEQDKQAYICILSRDGGYDVLVEHLKENRLCADIIRLNSLQHVANGIDKSPSGQIDVTLATASDKKSQQEHRLSNTSRPVQNPPSHPLIHFSTQMSLFSA